MSFAGKVALVAGASGNIGSGAVRAFLDQGAQVIALSRSQSSLNKLSETLQAYNIPTDNLITYVADVGKDEDLAKLANDIKANKYPAPDHIVSSSGPWWNLPSLQDISVEKFREVMNANFESHFFIYRNFAPFVLDKPGATYTLVTGSSGESGFGSLTAVTQSSLFGLGRVAIHETQDKAVRFNELRIGIRVESDISFDDMAKAGNAQLGVSPQLLASREFSPVFAALASSKASQEKGKVQVVQSRAHIDELKKYL